MNQNMQNKQNGKIGLLPMYLALYDQHLPETRNGFMPFLEKIHDAFTQQNVEVITASYCRLDSEFQEAIRQFEEEDVDCIVTLHLSYSPSLECIHALSKTRLPIIVFDTTIDSNFDSPSQIMYNHGIHGVQDMCNLLLRNGKDFIIESGHIDLSEVIAHLVNHIQGAKMAHQFKKARIGQIGEPFKGMGDFQVEPAVIQKKLGFQVIQTPLHQFARYFPDANESAVHDELIHDQNLFDLSDVDKEFHLSSIKTGIALRRWLETEQISGFTINFLSITRDSGLPQMPFLEIGKAMSRGIGYAGEGDVLTAALVGTLSQVIGNATFSEMFCPNWSENSIFLSHMGEMNVSLAAETVQLKEKPWTYSDAETAIYPSACYMKGEAAIVNLAPGADDRFSLIVSPITMVEEKDKSIMQGKVRGWFKPRIPLSDFLKRYSEEGGTHHIAIVYGDPVDTLKTFARIMQWNFIEIK
jgi:L-arabinose isomerase